MCDLEIAQAISERILTDGCEEENCDRCHVAHALFELIDEIERLGSQQRQTDKIDEALAWKFTGSGRIEAIDAARASEGENNGQRK